MWVISMYKIWTQTITAFSCQSHLSMDTPNMDRKTELASCWHPLQIACLPGTLQEAVTDGKNWAQTVGRVVHILLVAVSKPVTSPAGIMRPSDFRLLRDHNNHLESKPLATDADMKQAVNSWLQRLCTFLLHEVTSLGATVVQMLTRQYCPR